MTAERKKARDGDQAVLITGFPLCETVVFF